MIKNILEIVDIDFLQNMQDFFSKTMDIPSIIVDDNGPITQPSNFTPFCTKIRELQIGRERCLQCEHKWAGIAAKEECPKVYTCHAGLTDFTVPIMLEHQHIASIYGGQMLLEQPNEKVLRSIAQEMGLDEEKYLDEIKNINIVSKEKLNITVDFLYKVANSISAVLYANLKLSKIGLSYKPTRTISMENFFFSNCHKLAKPITEREFEVLKLIVLGKTNTEIAKELYISVHTVKSHVSSILEKLLVEDRVQIAVKAVREGLL